VAVPAQAVLGERAADRRQRLPCRSRPEPVMARPVSRARRQGRRSRKRSGMLPRCS
jgi:hypothetical protein